MAVTAMAYAAAVTAIVITMHESPPLFALCNRFPKRVSSTIVVTGVPRIADAGSISGGVRNLMKSMMKRSVILISAVVSVAILGCIAIPAHAVTDDEATSAVLTETDYENAANR
ncbi:hypothetical protein [Bifidobacterium erythrocebi]|uniref:hypothetical protein n=1 Tax=Bifidobacterium erythrocebi TaxID=2675325 RepID=UPI00145D3B6C|nr:hypothetical protein [Bifidobacterium sp. DSM 109960]